jgi:hypothetical protein
LEAEREICCHVLVVFLLEYLRWICHTDYSLPLVCAENAFLQDL